MFGFGLAQILVAAMAILGGIVSAHAPTKWWQKFTYALMFVALGIGGLYFTAKESREAAADTAKHDAEMTAKHDAEMADLRSQNRILQEKLDAFRTEVDGALATLGPKHYERTATDVLTLSEGAKATAIPALSEPQRRQAMLQALRREYILDHDMSAGAEGPPVEWLNQRLRELKEKWKVADGPNHQLLIKDPS